MEKQIEVVAEVLDGYANYFRKIVDEIPVARDIRDPEKEQALIKEYESLIGDLIRLLSARK